MAFTLKQLRYVEAAGRLGSIAKAAVEMAISQSSITAAIDSLEDSLDYDLFVRTPAKGIRATPSGLEALHLIRGFIHNSRHFEAELKSIGGDAAGLVRIACYATAAPAFLPPILKTITEKFPGISVQVLEGNMESIMQFLHDGKADLVFTYRQGLKGGEAFQPLFDAPPYALVSADDSLANQTSVTYAELADRPMVMLDLPLTRDYFLGLFKSRGMTPNVTHSTRSAEIARALVGGGFGFTILNIRPADFQSGTGTYRALPILDETETQTFGIATLDETRQPKTVRAFIDSCLQLRDDKVFEPLTVWHRPASSPKKSVNEA